MFIDFERGDLLYLTCKAEIIWDDEEKRAFVGAERLVRLTVEEGVLVESAVPIRWNFGDYSPSLSYTGSWQEVDARIAALKEGNKYRNYRVQRVERESDTITSFYLEPEDGKQIPCHVAGQFLLLQHADHRRNSNSTTDQHDGPSTRFIKCEFATRCERTNDSSALNVVMEIIG